MWSGLRGGGSGLVCVGGGVGVVRVEGAGVGVWRGWSRCGQG